MPDRHFFHPEARREFIEAVDHYFYFASIDIADAFSSAVRVAVGNIVATPTRYPIVEFPEIRRFVFRRFPFVIYYRIESGPRPIAIYAVMHCSRKPGYWRDRLG